jgi:hypothetical protein
VRRIDPTDPKIDEVDRLPDEVLLNISKAETWNGWYASLSKPTEGLGRFFHADFAKAADTREEAIRRCVTAIKEDLRKGESSNFTGIDLFYLLDHWKGRDP